VDIRRCGYQALWISGVVDIRRCGYQALWISGVVDIRRCGYQALWIIQEKKGLINQALLLLPVFYNVIYFFSK
jgi:ribosomal protein L40E